MPTKYRLIIPFLILLATIIGLWLFAHEPRMAELVVGDETFTVEVVDTPSSRAKGLGGRESLATSTGMLFIFEEPDIYQFWMKDMAFSIDIAWINGDWCVVNIAHNVSPETFPDVFIPSEKSTFVLEVQAGVLASKNIGTTYCFQPPLI